MTLHGTRVLVTGATGGLGPSTVEGLLAVGADVVAAARRRTALDELRAQMKNHDRLHVAECDVTDALGVEALFDSLEKTAPIEGVVHAVGAFAYAPLVGVSDADLERLIDTNFVAAALVLRAALRRMIPRERGVVVLVAADRALAPAANVGLYGATKAALCHLAQAAALEAEPHGVRVNALLPGTMDTPENRQAMPEADASHWLPPIDVAKAAIHLFRPDASAISGALVRLGGR